MPRRGAALPEKIAQDLLARILRGEFGESSILPPERTIQETYGVSRTVVREALKLLAARGVITTGTGQNNLISTNFTTPAIDALLLALHRAEARLDDVLTTRQMLEPLIASQAAQHATQLQIRRMHELCASMADLSQAIDAGHAAQRSYDLNAQFHTLIAQASQNPVLEILITLLVGIIWRQENTIDLAAPLMRHQHTADQHRLIVLAIEARDSRQAEYLMREHLGATRTSIAHTPGTLDSLLALQPVEAIPNE